jgi:hypothetical protein
MTRTAVAFVALAMLSVPLVAQEPRPVPKDSMRVSVPGCSKGYVFTAGPRTEAQPGSLDIPEGLRLRMNGPKSMIAEIRAREGSVLVITGLMKNGQYEPGGVAIGGVRISPGPAQGGRLTPNPVPGQIAIDVEGWRPGVGECRSDR